MVTEKGVTRDGGELAVQAGKQAGKSEAGQVTAGIGVTENGRREPRGKAKDGCVSHQSQGSSTTGLAGWAVPCILRRPPGTRYPVVDFVVPGGSW